jgi:hypothetical protein
MKRIMVMLFAAVLLLCGQMSAQNIVHYDVGKKDSGKIPDLQGTVVGIAFGSDGNLVAQIQKRLADKHHRVSDFTEGPNHCEVTDQPIICIFIGKPYSVGQTSGSDSSSFDGGGAYMSGNSNHSGDLIVTPVYVELRNLDGSKTLLGSACIPALAGTMSSGGSFGGSGFSSNSYSTTNQPANVAVGRSLQDGVNYLLRGRGWMPWAREAVRAAYNQPEPKK